MTDLFQTFKSVIASPLPHLQLLGRGGWLNKETDLFQSSTLLPPPNALVTCPSLSAARLPPALAATRILRRPQAETGAAPSACSPRTPHKSAAAGHRAPDALRRPRPRRPRRRRAQVHAKRAASNTLNTCSSGAGPHATPRAASNTRSRGGQGQRAAPPHPQGARAAARGRTWSCGRPASDAGWWKRVRRGGAA